MANSARLPAAQPAAQSTVDNPSRRAHEADTLRLLRLVFRATRQHMQLIEKRCGVPGAQVWTMAELARSPGIRVSDLAAALTVHQSTISNLLLKLEESGFVARERSEDDQRVVHLKLTRSGSTVVARAPKPLEGTVGSAVKAMKPSELKQLHDSLLRLTTLMAADDEASQIPRRAPAEASRRRRSPAR